MKKENGKWNSKTNIGIIALFVFSIMLMTSINACGFLGIGDTARLEGRSAFA